MFLWNTFLVVFWGFGLSGFGCWILGDLGKGEERKKRMVYKSCGQLDVLIQLSKSIQRLLRKQFGYGVSFLEIY